MSDLKSLILLEIRFSLHRLIELFRNHRPAPSYPTPFPTLAHPHTCKGMPTMEASSSSSAQLRHHWRKVSSTDNLQAFAAADTAHSTHRTRLIGCANSCRQPPANPVRPRALSSGCCCCCCLQAVHDPASVGAGRCRARCAGESPCFRAVCDAWGAGLLSAALCHCRWPN
jgi:hypothetical protein